MRNKQSYAFGDFCGQIVMNRELSVNKFKQVGLNFSSLPLILARVALLIVQFNRRTSRTSREDVSNTFSYHFGVGNKQ